MVGIFIPSELEVHFRRGIVANLEYGLERLPCPGASLQTLSGMSVKVASGRDEFTQQIRAIVQARSDHVKDVVLAL